MYVPPAFKVDDDEAWAVVHDAGVGILITPSPEGMLSVVAPVLVSEDRRTVASHVARANPWWRAVSPESEVLALFVAASTYVSPALYPSRLEQPGVVPTWNYVAAEVRGRATVHQDPEWLRTQVTALTDRFEAGHEPRWWVTDAPEEYIERQLRAIVGLEITVASIEGKAKLSQNRPDVDRRSVRDHFSDGSLAERNVAARMIERE
jgi:transcriptional regulator